MLRGILYKRYRDVLYFENITRFRFHGTRINIIKFAPVRKIRVPCVAFREVQGGGAVLCTGLQHRVLPITGNRCEKNGLKLTEHMSEYSKYFTVPNLRKLAFIQNFGGH